MRVLITGASGLVGSHLASFLAQKGDQVFSLVRSTPKNPNEISWDPKNQKIDPKSLEGFDAIIHLAGENIADGRWTTQKKAGIRDSRVIGTQFLSQQLALLQKPPQVFISGSATGYYGDSGVECLTEDSPPGTGFLAEVCQEWEAATTPAQKAGIRVVLLRTGMVLSMEGGALAKMLKQSLGGTFGDGHQYVSWITLEDLISVIIFAVQNKNIQGPLNAVSPGPVTNKEFTQTLAKVLRRGALLLRIPAFILRLVVGEMAQELLLAGAFVEPKKLEKFNFEFKWPTLQKALGHIIAPWRPEWL
jgi:uncharacterized protein (TIGR01777 family)